MYTIISTKLSSLFAPGLLIQSTIIHEPFSRAAAQRSSERSAENLGLGGDGNISTLNGGS